MQNKTLPREKSLGIFIFNFIQADAIEGLKNPTIHPDTPTTANYRYSPNNLGTWSSISDVDTFFSRFNHANDYKDGDVELALRNYVTIQDGTYNAVWMIAGFDMEHNQTSADNNKYDNGLGICMIPQTSLDTSNWNSSETTAGGYMSSKMHNSYLPNIVTKLQNVLGSHIVNRNVLLSSSTDGSNHSSAYTWTNAYATLMSVGQLTGDFAANYNKYDDGEANYKLPIFNSIDFKMNFEFWLRGIQGYSGKYRHVYTIDRSGIGYRAVTGGHGVRPLIYLR